MPTSSTGNCKHCSIAFSSKNKSASYCSNRCQHDHQFENDVVPRIEAGEVWVRRTLRNYLEKRQGHLCQNCSRAEWMGEPIPLELDHIDGNAANNYPYNLRLLCPNCHALTPTAKGKNKGSGRKSRGIKVGY